MQRGHKGNGVWCELPLPKGVKGTAIVYSLGGRAVVLKKGEGFDVADGKVVFVEPPP